MGEDAESLKCREVLTNNGILQSVPDRHSSLGQLRRMSRLSVGCSIGASRNGSVDPLFRLHVSDLLPQL